MMTASATSVEPSSARRYKAKKLVNKDSPHLSYLSASGRAKPTPFQSRRGGHGEGVWFEWFGVMGSVVDKFS